jgi:site-specific recombinase XerD
MATNDDVKLIIPKTAFSQDVYLLTWVEAFLLDRRANNVSPATLHYYRATLKNFCDYCEAQVITGVDQLTPDTLRRFLLFLIETDHKPGGVAAYYRAVKAFLNWYESEAELEGWKNPIRKVKTPKIDRPLLDPASLDDVTKLLKVCGGEFAERDRAMLLCLLDTGARAQEFLSVDLEDVDQVTGTLTIRHGKGRKSRTVFLGKTARKALRNYLKTRVDNDPALWLSRRHTRLEYAGLRMIVSRRAADAGINPPELHSFRRAFALNMLRAGVDVYSLAELMGHSDLQTLKRYLKQDTNDLQAAHAHGSPVERMMNRR